MLYLQCLEAFSIAALMTFLELVTSKYPRTVNLVAGSASLYAYACVYGLCAVVVTLLYPLLYPAVVAGSPAAPVHAAETGLVAATAELGALVANNPWVRAAVIGLTTKAFLHVRILEIRTGPGKSFPFGTETIVQLFEPWLLRNIGLDYYIALTRFLAPVEVTYADVNAARARALAHIPVTFDASEKAAMTSDLNAAATVFDVLQVYLSNVGSGVFRNTFP